MEISPSDFQAQCKPIDRNSPIPYYIQIIHILRQQIEEGNWGPGFHLPGELDLSQIFGVSRTVIRQALAELVNQGLIVRERGRGTFVTKPKIRESLVQRLTGFHHDMVDRGYEPETQVLELEITPASSRVASKLQIPEGEPVLKLTRKRSIEGVPIVLVTTYLPYKLCPGLEKEDFEKQSLYEILERKYGLSIASGRRTVEAVAANEHEAQMLKIGKGAPLILLESISYLEDGIPLEYYHAVHRGDRARFEVELVRYREVGENRKPLGEVADLPRGNVLINEAGNEERTNTRRF